MLAKQGNPVFEQKMTGIGAPSKEMITLRATADGVTTIIINYRQPFDRGERQTRYIDLTGGQMPEVIDLSNPYQVQAACQIHPSPLKQSRKCNRTLLQSAIPPPSIGKPRGK